MPIGGSFKRMRLAFLGCLVVLSALGCGDDDGEKLSDAATSDSAFPDSGMSIQDASQPDVSQGPELPSCLLACDRVLDCAAVSCAGVDWRTARLAQDICDDACAGTLSADVMAANTCDDVMGVVMNSVPALDTLCKSPVCASACQRFAACTRQGCERYAGQTEAQIAAGCMGWCDDESAGGILGVTCDALLDSLDMDPNFAASCHGSMGCADRPTCIAYAQKTTACALENCAGNADDYAAGIEAVLVDYCATAEDCPAPESIAILLDDAVTCDDPPMNEVGPAAPFTAICAGTVGAPFPDLTAACDTLIACGAEFASSDLCATFLTFDPGTATKVTCIDAASDCTGAFQCL
jgi:hypothetical protein